jgi:two-component system CheB/CheR fusion protein
MCSIGHADLPFGLDSNVRATPHPQAGVYVPSEMEIRAELQEIEAGQVQPDADPLKILNDLVETVCAKLVVKIRELDRATGDLQNLINVTAIPAIFVDENLRIRDFTPAMRKIYLFSDQDIGRSLLEFACSLNYCDLEYDFRHLTETGETVERYVEGRDGKVHYSVRMMPNFCRDNAIGGATLTFSEIMTFHNGRA